MLKFYKLLPVVVETNAFLPPRAQIVMKAPFYSPFNLVLTLTSNTSTNSTAKKRKISPKK